MNKQILLIGAAILILLLGGAGVYMMLNQSEAKPQVVTKTISNTPTPTRAAAAMQSLKELMATADHQECSFGDAQSGNKGTIYIEKGKMRGDFESTVNAKVTKSHMIQDGVAMYVWMDGQAQGFKSSLDAIEKVAGNVSQQTAVDLNKKANYNCKQWTIKPGIFDVPTNVTFQDFSKMMQGAASGSATMQNQAACSACSNLPPESQAQCKAALKCN